jgi:translocation and assembly module TamB
LKMEDGQPSVNLAKPWWRHLRYLLPLLVLGLLLVAFAGLSWLDSPSGQRWISGKIAGQTLKSGLSIKINKVDGSLFDQSRVQDVELRDLKGTFLIIHDAQIKWQPTMALRKKIIISQLHIEDAQWLRRPVLNPADPDEPLLPAWDIDISDLRLDQLRLAPEVAGERFALKGKGDLHITRRALRTDMVIDSIGTPDHAIVHLAAEPDRNHFDIDSSISAERGGVLARLVQWPQGFALKIAGKGDYKNWQGKLQASSDTAPLADLALHMRSGIMSASGTLSPHPALPAGLRQIVAHAPQLFAQGKLARPILSASAKLSGPGGSATVQGQIDLDAARILVATAEVKDPEGLWLKALLPDAATRDLSLAATMSGPLRDPDITLDARAKDFYITQTHFKIVQARFTGKVGQRSLGMISVKTAQVLTGVASTDAYLQKIDATAQLDSRSDLVELRDMRAASSLAQLRGDLRYTLSTGAMTATIRNGNASIDTGGFGRLPATFSGAISRARRDSAYGIAINAAADTKTWSVPAELKQALGVAPTLQGRARLETSGKINAEQLTLITHAGRFSGSGSYFNHALDVRMNGVISNLAALAPDVPVVTKGPLPITLVVQGSVHDPKINAEVRGDDVTFSGFRTRNLFLTLAPQDARDWRVGIRSLSDFGAVEASVTVRRGARLKLENLQGRIGPAALSGTLVQTAAGPWQGVLQARVNAETGEKGLFDVTARLDSANGAQSVDFNVDGRNLDRRYRQEQLLADSLQAKGTLTLGKTPTLNLTAEAKNLRWRDFVLTSFGLEGGGALADATFKYRAVGTRGIDFAANGVLSTKGARGVDAVAATLDGKLGTQSIRFATPLTAQRLKNGWQLLPTKLQLGRGSIDISGTQQAGLMAADVTMSAMPLDFVELLRPGFGVTGLASGTAKIGLRGDKLVRAEGALTLKQLRRAGLFQSAPTLEIASRFELGGSGLNISGEARSGGKAAGNLALLILADKDGGLSNGALRGKFLWDGPVDALSGLSGFDAHDLRGPLRMDANISGRLREPDLDGTIQMTGGRYENLALGLTANDLQLIARFKGSKIAIESATAKLVGGGTLSARGTVDVSAERGFPVKMSVSLNKAAILKRDDLDVIASGELDVAFGDNAGKISGPLKLDRMRLNASTSTTPEDVPQVAYKERNAPKSALAAPRRVIAPWELDIAVAAPQNIFVGGLGLISEWGGNFSIVGNTQVPALSGQLQVIRGTYEFAGRRFNIDRGTVNFQSKDRINPVLNIQASARINDVTGLITIQGTAQKPLIGFSSNPNLPKDEVMARVLFGTSIDQLSPLEGAQLAGAIAQLSQGSAQKLNVFGTVSKFTRIDRLRVLPANEQIGSGTAISAGKYIGDRLYIEAATDGRGYTATNIEVTLTRALSILSQIATLGGTNINIKWSKDY